MFAIEETTYIDRDFSAAYASFYSTLYHMRPRYCRRIHFFASSVSDAFDDGDLTGIAHALEAAEGGYLGFIVIRPLRHAPVGSAVLATRCAAGPGVEISVRSTYKVHFLGVELSVEGVPVTEQDTRTGSCAQATIWTAGRHFHNQHSTPWFSVPDITEAALKPTDSILAKSLPAGSDYLTDDNMVRALRAMGEHPIVYAPEVGADWEEPPARTIARYLDSGIPVIIGLRQGEGIGHAVVAVGTVIASTRKSPDGDAHMADRITHLIVNDDQNGAYRRIAVASPKKAVRSADYTLKDAIFLLVPLPSKVYMKAEVAETIARDKVRFVATNRSKHIKEARADIKPADWAVDPDFYATKPEQLVARTYLTHGWKYKHRLMRNGVADDLREELAFVHLPRYVWVTEFSLPEDVASLDPCRRKIRAHVVLDATGSRFEDSVLLTHLPGIIIGQSFDPANPGAEPMTSLRVLLEDAPYYPKIRGMADFTACEPETVTPANDAGGQIAA
ncbi:hypothetical protein E5673_14775 [Sphingomonas sp. PAMC26645]|uniref:hypothetical protein n=1 Tax=Sphingomonas sp. PAMC26645 TaxID=2565555 RepID=UPI00109DE845|nr:hypothetical protein [Sphingomonas sp. PAMC26645]QCB43333.1 hypothetical protein E5673_14775 [Sphingomonas sp. PAMC26645]